MDALFEALNAIPRRPLGALVLVGSGALALDSLDPASAVRIVLIDGDPGVAADLRRSARNMPTVRVVERAIAPTTGPVSWHRYNLRRLNGPADASQWSARYPRMRQIETRTVQARTLTQLIDELALPESTDLAPNVLLLDLPGQEDMLLAATDGSALRRFDWIVLRQGYPAGSAPACTALAEAGFFALSGSKFGDTARPVALFQYDRGSDLRRRLQALEAELTRRTEAAEAALAAARKQASEAEAARNKLLEQIADRDARQLLLDAEILKAEAQLELVKDVLLREKNF